MQVLQNVITSVILVLPGVKSFRRQERQRAAYNTVASNAGKNKRPAGRTCEPSGGLLWIDQEVVTLRGLFGNSGLLTDLRQADAILTHR